MWNGVFSPNIKKHRDYEHATFAEHEFDNGGYYIVKTSVYCDRNPVEGSIFEPSRLYYLVEFHLHNGDVYYYLVPAESDKSQPNRDNISRTIDAYARNPVDGGRDIFDYIDEERTEESDFAEARNLTSRRQFW